MQRPPDIDAVRQAQARIAPYVHRTPILTSRLINAAVGAELFFKCENFQRAGVFKARGAFNAVMALADEQAARGVVTHSSGNHAAAVALAAATRGIPATIVMPHTAPAVKKAAVEGYGGRIVLCAPEFAAREAAAAAVIRATGATLVPPFDSPLVIAGQGTCYLEMLADLPRPLSAITCPVGGGGMMCGTAIVAAALSPEVRVVAAEPAAADDAARGFLSGVRQPQVLPIATIADGLTTALSDLTFGIMRRHVDAVVRVSEAAIIEAMRLIWTRMKILVEPSSAVPLAAILERRWDVAGGRIGVILTGGNVDPDHLPWP